jgi:sigma-B regulation protein RsbU (phosphoserine phosphatase)
MFVTLFCAVFEPGKERVSCASAGHPSLVLVKPGAPPRLPVAPTGGVAGFMPGLKVTRSSIEVRPGDSVVLYTDGVTEAMDGSDELFGEERLVAQLAARPGGTAAEAIAGVVEAVRAFVGARAAADDIAIVAIRRNS